MMGRKTMIAAAAVVLVAVFAIVRQGETADPAASGPPLAVAERGELAVRAEAAGVIEPILVVEVKSKASGEVLQLFVETGDNVARGSQLAQIDPRDVQNALDQALADLQVAQVQAQTAEAQRQRTEELRQANVVTQQEYETAIQQAANANAALVRAQTNLQLARERRGDVAISAPIDGTIIERTVEVGQIIASATSNVSGGTTLLKMADLSVMQVRALVDETDIGEVRPGLPVAVTVEAYPTRVFHGEVLKIEPQAVIEQNVTMFPVLVRLDNEEGLLRPGMNATISIEIARRADVVLIPNEAVVAPQDVGAVAAQLGAEMPAGRGGGEGGPMARQGGAPAGDGPSRASGTGRPVFVFVRTGGTVEARPISLGLSDWERSEVILGVEPGDTLLLATMARMEAQQQQRFGPPGFGPGVRRGG